MQIEKLAIAELSSDPANARKHGEQNIATIVASLKRFGQQKPIVIDISNVVRAGNGTLEAARSLGWTHIDCVRTDLKGSDAIAYAIADNRTAELAEWDDDVLAATLNGLLADDPDLLNAAGFSEDELAELLGDIEGDGTTGEIVEDEVPEPPIDPITKPGDLWILGRHRVLCGDSTKAEDVGRLMDGDAYELLMIDPPYGIKASSMTMGSAQSSKPRSDRLSNVNQWDNERPPISHLLVAKSCVWGGNYFAHDLPVSDDWLCWHKKNDNLSFGEFELAWCSFGKRTRHLAHHWGGEKKEHITQKPVAVIAWAIKQSETTGSVADFFLGSGTTLIAAEQLGRTCYGMEISPQYCDVIVTRWENLTGQKAVLDVDQRSEDGAKSDGAAVANQAGVPRRVSKKHVANTG